jgi:hypothetical protein
MIMPATARSDDIPNLDVRPICRGIASQSADPLATGLQATFEQCVQAEQDVREQLKKASSTFPQRINDIALHWLRQEENRATPSSSPVWKWREMCEV